MTAENSLDLSPKPCYNQGVAYIYTVGQGSSERLTLYNPGKWPGY
ncbi:hypothetical protein AGMMS49546_31330 [Spirochaetia bacterium]|nr:hypothetical protein AGMMS49546_31330 [Spirochaetia bacterium]